MGDFLARLRGLRGNKWAMAGAAGAAGLGGIALLRRGHGAAASGTAAAGDASTTSAGAGGQGQFPNTYQTDLATAVGNLDARYAGEVADFAGQLGTTSTAVATLTSTQTKQAADLAAVQAKVNAIKVPAPVKKKPAAKKPVKKKAPVKKKPAVKKKK